LARGFYTIVPIKNERLRKILKKICTLIYNGFTKILISSKGFKDIICSTGLNHEKIAYFPQWAEELYGTNDLEDGMKEKEDFVVIFAGNIGKVQSVDTIIEAANLCRGNKRIKWYIVGNGSEFENIKELVARYELTDTVILIGRKAVEEMPGYFKMSDGLLVTLKNEEILNATLPAKLQSYMASGKPIIAAINGEDSYVVKECNCGLIGQAEDYKKLYENVILLYNMDPEERMAMRTRGRICFEENFTKKKLLKQLIDIMM